MKHALPSQERFTQGWLSMHSLLIPGTSSNTISFGQNPTNAAQLSIQDVRSRTNCYRIPRSAQTFHFPGLGVCGFPLHLNTARRRRSELAWQEIFFIGEGGRGGEREEGGFPIFANTYTLYIFPSGAVGTYTYISICFLLFLAEENGIFVLVSLPTSTYSVGTHTRSLDIIQQASQHFNTFTTAIFQRRLLHFPFSFSLHLESLQFREILYSARLSRTSYSCPTQLPSCTTSSSPSSSPSLPVALFITTMI